VSWTAPCVGWGRRLSFSCFLSLLFLPLLPCLSVLPLVLSSFAFLLSARPVLVSFLVWPLLEGRSTCNISSVVPHPDTFAFQPWRTGYSMSRPAYLPGPTNGLSVVPHPIPLCIQPCSHTNTLRPAPQTSDLAVAPQTRRTAQQAHVGVSLTNQRLGHAF
jgi:hypothetical protein